MVLVTNPDVLVVEPNAKLALAPELVLALPKEVTVIDVELIVGWVDLIAPLYRGGPGMV